MSCNAIATVSTKISNEVFDKIKFTTQVQESIKQFLEKNGLNPSLLQKQGDSYVYYDKGTYIIIASDKVNVTGIAWDAQKEQDMADKLARYINLITNVVLRDYIKRICQKRGYKIVGETESQNGVISLRIEKA